MEGVILAAGKGTRMRPYSNAVNKEMSLIGPCPVIEYCVKALAACGVKQIFVVLSEGKGQITEFRYPKKGAAWGGWIGGAVGSGTIVYDWKIVDKSGTWFAFEGDRLGQGRENVKQYLKDNPATCKSIEEKVRRELGLIKVEEVAV